MPGRAWLLAVLFTIMTMVLVGRLFQLQVLHGTNYAADVTQSRIGVHHIPARRGRILDRHGTPLVDNRAVYDLAVELVELELRGRARHAIDFWRFDNQRLDSCIADLATRTMIPPEAIRAEIESIFTSLPSVARRRGKKTESGTPGLLAIRQNIFGDTALESDALSDGENASQTMRVDDALFESGLVFDDAREALARECNMRWGIGSLVLDRRAAEELVVRLSEQWKFPADMIYATIEPFTERVTGSITQVDLFAESDTPNDGETIDTWLIVTADNRENLEHALARFVGSDPLDVRTELDRSVRETIAHTPTDSWYFIPEMASEEMVLLLPESVTTYQVSLDGMPASRERIYLVQGDPPNGPGLFTLLCQRLAIFVGIETPEVARLLRNHAESVRITTMERRHRTHLMVFDYERLQRLTIGLTEVYRAAGLPGTVFNIERQLAEARRIADREWRGSTRLDPIVINRDIPQQVAVDLSSAGYGLRRLRDDNLRGEWEHGDADLPGLRVVSRIGRAYPFPNSSSHLIGWLGKLSATTDRTTALAMGLDPEGWTGTRGIEAVYDDLLQGVMGRQVRIRTPDGWTMIEGEKRRPMAGTDLHLTIDIELQLEVEEALNNWFKLAEELGTIYESGSRRSHAFAAQEINHGRAGMVILDCETGAILALASTPQFDLRSIRTDYNKLIDPEQSPGLPIHDNAAWAAQPPGSTVKPLVALAALTEGVFRPGETIHTDGYMARWRGRGILGDHPPVARDWGMSEAIQRSSNTFFATIGERLGPERLCQWMQRFGIGQNDWALDVSWQRGGQLPTPGTLYKDRPSDPTWHPSDTWRMAIGQFCTASPLQVASIAAVIANGGTIVRPHLWAGVSDSAVVEHLDLTPQALRIVREGMEDVTRTGGTAPWLQLDGDAASIHVAAKTGTSEWGSRASREAGLTPDNAWLMGYAPAKNPQIAFAIYIHAAGMSGGRACSGATKRVLERWWAIQSRR